MNFCDENHGCMGFAYSIDGIVNCDCKCHKNEEPTDDRNN
jgi:hypothetical protein